MNIEFRTNRLRRAFELESQAVRRWGTDVGRIYIRRLIQIQAAPSMEDLFEIRSLRFHPLTGDRRGQFAASLMGRWRLILERGADERTLIVVDVEDYHG